MLFVSPSDRFQVSKQSLISEADKEILFDFYAPIIGSEAVLLWILLLRYEKKGPTTFRDFFTENQFSQSDFLKCLPPLEAIGLVKTFLKQGNEEDSYQFLVFAPKTPSEFFSNDLLSSLLCRFVDRENVLALEAKYAASKPSLEGYKETTTDFSSFFQIGEDAYSVPSSDSKILGKKSGPMSLAFDRNLFFSALFDEAPDFPKDEISKENLVRLARIATLHGFDEMTMASLVLRSYDVSSDKGKRIDFKELRELANEADSLSFVKKPQESSDGSDVRGTSSSAKTIRLMEKLSPTEWLSRLQKGHKPAKSDLRLIDTLANDIGLPDSVINALIFFVLSTHDNVLNPNYVEKVGASLVRAGVSNALDAMNYLGEKAQREPGFKTAKKTECPSLERVKEEKDKRGAEEKDEEEDPLDILASL